MSFNVPDNRQQLRQDGATTGAVPSWYAVLLPWSLIFLSWVVLGIAFSTRKNVLIDHDYLLRTSHMPWIIALFIFLLCWQIMTIAMMLPSSVSRLLLLYETHSSPWRGQSMFILGYALVWSGFALLAFLGDTLVHQIIQHWWWLYLHPQIIGALTLGIAGICQWSPLKRSCLQHCITWPQEQETSFTCWQQGLRYGTWCVGSSWPLMLVMFGIGMKSLLVLVILTTIMFLEREVFKSRWLSPAIGSILLLLALLWYLFPIMTNL